MAIYQQGAINPTALIVPGLYVQIVPPQISLLNGVPTNILGIVGSASWGPVNSPVQMSGSALTAQLAAQFGPLQPRKYDLGTAVAIAVQQGAQVVKAVRVTDGTDTAASGLVTATDAVRSITLGGTITPGDLLNITVTPSGGIAVPLNYTVLGGDTLQSIALAFAALVNSNAILAAAGIVADVPVAGVFNFHYLAVPTIARTVTGTETITIGTATTLATTQISFASKWTGSLGNQISIIIGLGSQKNTTKVTVTIPGSLPEVFDNILGTGSVLWANIAMAITLGQSGIRTPSQIITATAGAGASAPTLPTTTALTGGTDGANSLTGASLVGVDTLPRTGMYALRNQGCSVGVLADCDDSTTWAAQTTFGLFEGVYMIATGPLGQSITAAATAKLGVSCDTYAMKIMLGDWIYWQDTVNGQQRLVSPQAFVAGRLSNLSPQNSSLNKQIQAIVATQKSATGYAYAQGDLQTLVQAGIDVIGSPSPGGAYFSALIGHNASSNPVIQGDNYTRMTNYIAATLNSGMGIYVGRTQSSDAQKSAKATLDAFFSAMWTPDDPSNSLIGSSDPSIVPWNVVLDKSNNPQSQVALGFMQASVQVIYLSIVEKFLVNVEGGQSVSISRLTTTPAN